MSIGSQFCGQSQPHQAHTWQESARGSGGLVLTQDRQCAGLSYAPAVRCPCPAHRADRGGGDVSGERRAPVNGSPRGTVAWSEHLKAWEAYHRLYRKQDAETIAARGGFCIEELTYQLGHLPRTWEPGPEALRWMERLGVTPAPIDRPEGETTQPTEGT